MLTEKEYLLLCEIGDRNLLGNNTINTSISECIAESKDSGEKSFFNCIEDKSELLKLKLKSFKEFKITKVYIFENEVQKLCVLFAKKDHSDNKITSEWVEEIAGFLKENIDSGKCVVTGIGICGLYASYIASEVDAEGIVFCAPATEELPGRVTNYVSVNDPVGNSLDKVVFVELNSAEENTDELYGKLLFDQDGKAVVGEQSEYSKFCSWFYNSADSINNDIWRIFFKDENEDDALLNKDMYLIYLKIDELNVDGVKASLKNVIKYMENEFEKSFNSGKAKLENSYKFFESDDMEGMEEVEEIPKVAEDMANKVSELSKNAYESVETILKGIGLFALHKNHFDIIGLMGQFASKIDVLLDKESERISELLDRHEEKCLALLSDFEF